MTGPQTKLDREQFAELFPFHFVVDREMRIIDAGDVLLRICPGITIGSPLANAFSLFLLASPTLHIDREYLIKHKSTLFVFKSSSSDLMLRLQLVILGDPERYIFLGSPWVRNPTELKALHLVLKDFALHDSTVDLLQLVQTTNTSLHDAKQLALRLELNRNELKELVDTANAPILTIDLLGKVRDWNQTTERLTGFSKADAVGKQFVEDFVNEESQQGVRKLLDGSLEGVKNARLEVMLNTRDDRKLLVIFSASPRHDALGKVTAAILVGHDITELDEYRTTLENRVADRTSELSLANAELSRVMRSKDDFLSAMSHELRTPLNAILGLSESLCEGVYGGLTDRQSKSINTIAESGHHLLSLINDLLDIAKIGAGKMELEQSTDSVEDVCQSSMRFVAELASKKKLRMSLVIDPNGPVVHADQRRLKQILVNLLSNAVKFTFEGGSVTLETKCHLERNVMEFSVVDSGIGIAPQDLERLFSPFTQLDSKLSRQYAGTGLGLSLVLRLAELQGGTVSVKSEVGVGSRFTVALPWKSSTSDIATNDHAQDQHATEFSAHESGPLILIADDNESNLLTVGDYLRAHDFRVIEARNGLEAVKTVRTRKPSLVLMGVQMPIMDGIDAIENLRGDMSLAAMPILALTSRAMVGDGERCIQAGANDYLSKPVNLKQLVQTIRNHLNVGPPK